MAGASHGVVTRCACPNPLHGTNAWFSEEKECYVDARSCARAHVWVVTDRQTAQGSAKREAIIHWKRSCVCCGLAV